MRPQNDDVAEVEEKPPCFRQSLAKAALAWLTQMRLSPWCRVEGSAQVGKPGLCQLWSGLEQKRRPNKELGFLVDGGRAGRVQREVWAGYPGRQNSAR